MNFKALHDRNPLILICYLSTKKTEFKYLTGRTEVCQCNIDTVQLIVMPTESDFHIEVDKLKEA